MRKILLAAAVVAVAIAIALLLPRHANAYAAVPLPAHFNFTVGIGTHGNESSELFALDNGVRYFRTDITLNGSQAEWIGYEHTKYGAQYIGILDYATIPRNESKTWNLSVWNESVAKAVSKYPYIRYWEIWNEPWVGSFQTGYMNGSAYSYYMLVKSAYTIIKADDPNATVICFGGAPIANYNVYQWYAQVWSYGASRYCDAISIHAYPPGPYPMNGSLNYTWATGLYQYEQLTHRPIYITEFGMPSSSAVLPGFSQGLQKEFMEQGFAFFSRFSYVKGVYWYDLWGLSDGALGNDFGLLNSTNPNGTPSEAWSTFVKIYGNSSSVG